MRQLRLQAASRPASVLVAGRSIGYVAAFAIPVVLARFFDQTEFGIYKQIFLIYGTLYVVAQLGVAESLYYFVPRKTEEGGRHAFNAVATLTLSGIVIAVLLGGAGDRLASLLRTPEVAGYAPLLGAFLALMLISAPFEIILVSRKRFLGAAWTYAASDAVRTALIILPVLLIGGLWWVLAGAVAFAALRVAAMLRALWREFGSALRPDVHLWRQQLTYALPFALAVAVEVAQMNFHQYVVAARFDAATFAIYAVGCLQIPLVDVVATSAANVMMVHMSADAAHDRPEAAVAVWHQTIARLASLILPLTIFLLLVAPDVITLLFTSSYAASVPIFMLWTLTIVPAIFCVDAVLRVYAQTRFMFAMNLVRLAIVASLIGWFLGAFGLAGAVLVTLASTAAVRLFGLVRIARLLHLGVREALPWGRLAGTLVCALIAAAPAYWIISSDALPRLLALASTFIAYGAVYLALYYTAFNGFRDSAAAPLRRRLLAWLTES